jgi:signal transduction histidine kinase
LFKSIFSRLMTANIFFMFICMLITGMLLFSFLSDYVIDQHSTSLLEDSKRVNDMTTYFLNNQGTVTEKLYFMNIEGLSNKLDGMIFITDLEGNVVIASEKFKAAGNMLTVNTKFVNEVLENGKMIKVTDFGGVISEECLIVGVPFQYRDKAVGATYLAIPVPEIYKSRFEVFKICLIAMIIAIAISVVFWYFLSLYMIGPIKSLNQVAKRISEGDFKVRVKVKGKDEIAQLGNTFNNMATSLENLENARSSFVANVSHELRTPMTTISGFVEGILDGTIPVVEQKKYLSIVLDETKRLARLVSELLALARMESGINKPKMTVFDINELVRVAVLGFEKQLMDNNITVDISFEEDKILVLAEKDSISRVLTNLFDNAIKFNFKNGYLKIKVYEKNKKVYISVENSGIGINSEELNLIWERFYKTDKSRSHDKKGVGLGLYLIQNIISAHGEKIWAESENNTYARFTFTLKSAQ